VIAAEEGTSKRRIQHMIELAFPAPDIVRDVLDGRQPLGFTSDWCRTHTLPSDWNEQRRMLAALRSPRTSPATAKSASADFGEFRAFPAENSGSAQNRRPRNLQISRRNMPPNSYRLDAGKCLAAGLV